MKTYNIVAFLGRNTGLDLLENFLGIDERFKILKVLTHQHLSKAEGRGLRPEYQAYCDWCACHDTPLAALDYPEAKDPLSHLPEEPIDLIVVLSWRFILSPEVLQRARVASVNLHRGDIQRYPGVHPVRAAIRAGETHVAITAHHMIEAVDAGPVIAMVWVPVAPLPDASLEVQAEAVKKRLEPLYVPLLRLALDAILKGQHLLSPL